MKPFEAPVLPDVPLPALMCGRHGRGPASDITSDQGVFQDAHVTLPKASHLHAELNSEHSSAWKRQLAAAPCTLA